MLPPIDLDIVEAAVDIALPYFVWADISIVTVESGMVVVEVDASAISMPMPISVETKLLY